MGVHGRSLLQKLYDEHKDKIEIILFAFSENYEFCANEEAKYKLGIPVITDLKGNNSLIQIIYGVEAVPTVYLLDKEGRIVLKETGYGEGTNEEAKKLF